MSIEWREAMNIGDPIIDADHRHLVKLLKELETAIVGPIDHKEAGHVLMRLAQYTADHFTREEELMAEIRYPYLESHRRNHREVLKKLTGQAQDYAGAEEARRIEMIRTTVRLLPEWLVGHILQSDLRMKPYVLQFRAQMDESEKRKRAAIAQSEARARAKAPVL